MNYVSLHNHTYASNIRLLDSINRPKEMIDKAIRLGFKGMAFTDHESLSAAIEILKIRDSIQKEHPDFKIIFGNEIYLIDEKEIHSGLICDEKFGGETQEGKTNYYHFILLAKDLKGWEQLKQLSSRAWLRSYKEKGQTRVPTTYKDIEEIIGTDKGHIIASTACFTKGHQVLTSNGLKNIEDIVSGDLVLTHTGEYQEVISPTCRDYNGRGYELGFKHEDRTITCTEDHKFLVYSYQHVKGNHSKVEPVLIWKEAHELKLGDKTLDLIPTYDYTNTKQFDISNIIEQYNKELPNCANVRYHLNSTITVTPELMRLYGLWLGDGSVSSLSSKNNGRVVISFNEKEFDYFYPFVEEGFKSLGNFNLITRVDLEHHRKEIIVNSTELAYLVRYISNDGKSDTKFIHSSLKHISKEMDAEILYGYLLADGYFRQRTIKHTSFLSDETVDATVSINLFNDITELYYSVGFVPRKTIRKACCVNGINHKKSYYHSVSCGLFSLNCNKKNILSHEKFIEYINERIKKHEKRKIVTYNNVKYFSKSVKSIKPIELNEKVYCLNVQNDHSFICNGIIVHNCLGGYLPRAILDHKVKEANSFIKWCIDTFGKENFNLEMQPSDSEEQIQVNKTLLKMAKHYDLPYIITTDSHYLDKEDFNIHKIFLNSKLDSDRETEKFYKYTYVMEEQEMIDLLHLSDLTDEEIQEGFNNTCAIGDRIEVYDFRHGTIVPKIKIPKFELEGIIKGKGYPVIDKFYDSNDEQDRYLMFQIERGLKTKKRWELQDQVIDGEVVQNYVATNKPLEINDTILERINKELDILDFISENLNERLSAYLNLTVNIVDIAWQVSLVGPGRGSACGFYINYLIGITQVDPLMYNLVEWRFLNKERVELPDVDEDFQPEKTLDIIRLLRENYGEDNVLNCATFKTEKLKSCILSCGRGLGYNNDDMQALAALVPSHRGADYTLKECLEGDEEKGFEPVPNFKEKLDVYDGLFNAVQKLEGLPTNASIHASALYVFNNSYITQNSLMRAPNGTKMTAFTMHDSDDMGALKMDVLRTDAESKIAKCLDLLVKYKQIEWQGNLRKTYDKYIHPDVLEYYDKQMWEDMSNGKIPNLFQFETMVGAVCIKKARPINVSQLAEINSIMRLQSEGTEQPIDRYVRFRNDPSLWDKEMDDAGLTKHEKEILKKYLAGSNGVSGSQEVLMKILMDPEVTGFTLGEANAARKAIAKKQAQKLIQLKKDFYDKGAKTVNSEG